MYNWNEDIQPFLGTLLPVTGGFTSAKRGIATLDDGKQVFIKVATDESTRTWIKKEIRVYKKLGELNYVFAPKLLAYNADETAMAIEYLGDHSFEDTWDRDKLEAIIVAQNALRDLGKAFQNDADFAIENMLDLGAKWPVIANKDNLVTINAKLSKFGADNFAYNPVTKQGKLIDWNWLCFGDASLDRTSLFLNMYQNGFDPYFYHPDLYDSDMITYLISFWLHSILNGNEDSSEREWKLRAYQAKNVDACVELLHKRDTIAL